MTQDNRRCPEPFEIVVGGCAVAIAVLFIGATYWYIRLFLTRGTAIFAEPIGILAAAMAIILFGGWVAAGVAVYQNHTAP